MPPPRISRSPLRHQRKPSDRLRPKHRAWIATLPCARCGNKPSVPAHVRTGTDGGAGLKPSDRFVVPLCHSCHGQQHQIGELTFWAELGADPVDLSNRLWAVTGDDAQGLRAIARFHQSIEMHRGTTKARGEP